MRNPQGPFDVVSLLIGVNDQYQHLDINSYNANFTACLQKAIALAGNRKDHVFVLSIPDWGVTPFAQGQGRARIGREIDQFNAVCRGECAKQNVAFIDITPISKKAAEDRTLVADDGLHPNTKGYRVMAPIALEAINRAGAQQPQKKKRKLF